MDERDISNDADNSQAHKDVAMETEEAEIVVGAQNAPLPAVPIPKSRRGVSRRKAIVRPKQRNTYKPKIKLTAQPSGSALDKPSTSKQFHGGDADEHAYAGPSRPVSGAQSESQISHHGDQATDSDEAYSDPQASGDGLHTTTTGPSEPEVGTESASNNDPPLAAVSGALEALNLILPEGWIVIADSVGFHCLLMSSSTTKIVQREIYLRYNGTVDVIIHCAKLPSDNEISKVWPAPAVFQDGNFQQFNLKAITLCNEMGQFLVCTGANHEESKKIWPLIPDSYVDLNPYLEESYTSSCRSIECLRLVPLRLNSTRCGNCSKTWKALIKRSKFSSSDVHPNTPNSYLNLDQAVAKLEKLQEENRKKDKRISYLESKIEKVLEEVGVDLDEDDSKCFERILDKANITGMQRTFLQEQIKSSTVSDRRAHRWHPAMIRWAIQVKSTSTAAFNILRDSGVVNLPHGRTLLDYSKAIAAKEGINDGLLKMVSEDVKKLPEKSQKYHALLFDEMYMSQNLVYRKSDGALVGYAYLDEVDKEVKQLEAFLQGKTEMDPKPLAVTMLAFMVKGLTSNVKGVIACYPCKELNKFMLHSRVWEVIGHCEGCGVKILCLVCDGHPTNRAFMKLHKPVHPRQSGIVYDTLNNCSPEGRILFFISDVAHLLKTIRNCLHNSRDDGVGRQLIINGEKLLWKVIVRLYFQFRPETLRNSYKLSALNVFPNSYSTMRVKYAAEVLSQSVANDLKLQKWPGTKELINFIEKINKFFDVLNGAHSSQATKKLNSNLAPYTDVNDERFEWLDSLWNNYFEAWRKQTEELNLPTKEQAKAILSYQSLEGIEISILSITAATRFLLTEGEARFVMARTFSQDPLEQNFSRQRAFGGGNTHPNAMAFENNQVSISVQRQLKQRHRNANVEDDTTSSEVDSTPVEKRRRNRK